MWNILSLAGADTWKINVFSHKLIDIYSFVYIVNMGSVLWSDSCLWRKNILSYLDISNVEVETHTLILLLYWWMGFTVSLLFPGHSPTQLLLFSH